MHASASIPLQANKMRIILLRLYQFLLFMLLTSCRVNSEYINREEDKRDAEAISSKLYEYIKAKDYESTWKLFSKDFLEVLNMQKLYEIYVTTSEKLGDLKDVNLETWETRRIEGSNPFAEYTLVYKNKYDKYDATETIKLRREKDEEIRIVSYNIISNGFME